MCSGCSKEFWKVLNNTIHKSKTKKLHVHLLTTNDTPATDPKDICNHFNYYFSRVGENKLTIFL